MSSAHKSMQIIAPNRASEHELHGIQTTETPMKLIAAALASLFVTSAQAEQPNIAGRRLSPEDVRTVAPALEKYTQDRLYGEVWKRPGLTPRDRSLVTIAALIARDLTLAMPYYFNRALDKASSPPRFPRSSRISRSIPAGRMPLRR